MGDGRNGSSCRSTVAVVLVEIVGCFAEQRRNPCRAGRYRASLRSYGDAP